MRRARGAAIIVAMLVAALAATVAVALAGDQQRWLADVSNRRDQVQAQSLALAGVQWARRILQDDARAGPIDHLGEIWAFPLPATPIANGTIAGRIEDAQGRVNLNNAALPGTVGDAERARLARLLTTRGVDPRALAALAAWIDRDPSVATGAGRASPGSPAAPAPFALVRAAELTAVGDIAPAAWAALAPVVVALPPGSTLNVNTAGAEVLGAAIPGLAGEKLAAFLAERARRPFTTLADLRERLPPGVTLPPGAAFAFASSYFLVTVESRQGVALAQVRALVKRDGRGLPGVVWQTLE